MFTARLAKFQSVPDHVRTLRVCSIVTVISWFIYLGFCVNDSAIFTNCGRNTDFLEIKYFFSHHVVYATTYKGFFLRYVIKLRWISWLINFINFFAETNNFFRKIFVGFLLFSFFSSFALILILPKVIHFLSTPSSSQMN